ncbi:MAG: glycine betaine ABC transporter substrate-binding protein [Mycobacterium sp.]
MAARRLAVALLALLLVAGCGGTTTSQSIAVGARDDAESTLLAHLYAGALRSYGTAAHVEVVTDPLIGLDSGDISVVPGLTGRLLDTFAPGAKARAAAQVYRDMVSALPEGVAAGDYAESAEDKPALAVTEATIDAWRGRDVTAAVHNCDKLRIGHIVGTQPPQAIGTCAVTARGYPDAGTLFEALRTGQVNAVWTSTADADIPADAVVLTDRTALIRAENVVPLYRRNELSEMQMLALNEVAGVLDTAGLVQMRRQVAAGTDPAHVADGFLAEHPLGATSR